MGADTTIVFEHPWCFALLPLRWLLRLLLPTFRDSRDPVRVAIFDIVTQSLQIRPSKGPVVRRRSLLQGLLFVACWVAVRMAGPKTSFGDAIVTASEDDATQWRDDGTFLVPILALGILMWCRRDWSLAS